MRLRCATTAASSPPRFGGAARLRRVPAGVYAFGAVLDPAAAAVDFAPAKPTTTGAAARREHEKPLEGAPTAELPPPSAAPPPRTAARRFAPILSVRSFPANRMLLSAFLDARATTHDRFRCRRFLRRRRARLVLAPESAEYRGDVRGYGTELAIFIDAAPYPPPSRFLTPAVHAAGPAAAFPWDTSRRARTDCSSRAATRTATRRCAASALAASSRRRPAPPPSPRRATTPPRASPPPPSFATEPADAVPQEPRRLDRLRLLRRLIFHVMTDNANEWLWADGGGPRVLLPRKPFLDGALTPPAGRHDAAESSSRR